MAIVRVNKTRDYTVMSNYHFKEKGMSLKAKGLLSLMLSLPDDWDYSINGLATLSKDGKDSVMSALTELEKFGYLKRTKSINEKGQFAGYDYDIYEKPIEEKTYTEKPNTDKPNTENQVQLNTNTLNTNVLTTELLNTDKIDKIDKSDIAPFQPNGLTKKLIENGYIEQDDIRIDEYNNIFVELIDEYSFEIVRSCLYYFIKRYGTQQTDENGNEIENKVAYFRAAMTNGAERLERDNNKHSGLNLAVGSWLYN